MHVYHIIKIRTSLLYIWSYKPHLVSDKYNLSVAISAATKLTCWRPQSQYCLARALDKTTDIFLQWNYSTARRIKSFFTNVASIVKYAQQSDVLLLIVNALQCDLKQQIMRHNSHGQIYLAQPIRCNVHVRANLFTTCRRNEHANRQRR